MGEVYRARDTRLDRDVAIKILPERFASNPTFRSRFERETKAVAALSHPNILAIHDVGIEGGVPFSVTEMLRGGTLREAMTGAPLSPRRAVEFGIQVARGLAAAHDRGIVHRDLKPDNIFITEDGHAKILDFGLALAIAPAEGGDLTHAPTLGPGTEPGTVLGTIGYMSPEQVRGQPLDARSDLFSLGAVLYEMLAGRRAFQADTAADTMTAILREEPPELHESGRMIPPALDRIVRHCLEKNPLLRFQTARDLAFNLEAALTASGSGPAIASAAAGDDAARGDAALAAATRRAAARGRLTAVAALASGLLIGAVATRWLWRPAPAAPPALHALSYSGRDFEPAASPDGRLVAFASTREGRTLIWLKQYPGGDEVALTGGPEDLNPRFSPDGSQVLFVRREAARHSLHRIPVVGGEPRKILDDADRGEWSPDGSKIAFLRVRTEQGVAISSLWVADASGQGEKEIARTGTGAFDHPRWSPDGGRIALVQSGTENSQSTILLVAPDGGSSVTLTPAPPAGRLSAVAWSGSGSALVYEEAGSIVQAGAAGGSGRLIRQEIGSGRSEVVMWIPATVDVIDILGPGRLLIGSRAPRENLLEVPLGSARAGAGAGAGAGAPGPGHWLTRGSSVDRQPAFSPDGQWIIFSSNRTGNLDLWKLSVTTGALRRITEDAADDWDPAFTPDGKSIIWSTSRSGHFEIWTCAADGTGARQVTSDGSDAENPTATPDGRFIVYNSGNPEKSGIWKIHPDGSGATRIVPGTWSTPEVSPDGTWVAFRTSAEPRIVRVARIADGEVQHFTIEAPGNTMNGRPRWMPGGKALAFTGSDGHGGRTIFAQAFVPGQDTTATRRPLAALEPGALVETFGISPDGARAVYALEDRLDSILLAEGLPGIEPPVRRSK
jgi:eukaryotic-like serine/threonine-protein kinase